MFGRKINKTTNEKPVVQKRRISAILRKLPETRLRAIKNKPNRLALGELLSNDRLDTSA